MKTATKFAITFLFAGTCLAQPPATKRDCNLPVVLTISVENTKILYELNGKKAPGYPLDEVAHAIYSCSTERMLFVVATPEVPQYAFVTPPKLQANKVRYFIHYGGTYPSFQEVMFGRSYTQLPLTADIKPEPEDNDTPPPTSVPNTKGTR